MTHTETHTGKRADKNNGEDRTYLPQYTERKGSKIPENRQTEHPDTLRDQQVMCSSHTTSSKKHRKLRFSMLFVAKTLKKVWVKMWVNCLTHTVTHTRNYPDRSKEYRRGSFCLLSGIFAFSAYMICAMRRPIFSAAFCCICLVAWV